MIYKKKPSPQEEQEFEFDPDNAPEEIDAVQFRGFEAPLPRDMHTWASVGYQPRDGSWGYIDQCAKKRHVYYGDWIVYRNGEAYQVVKDEVFRSVYNL
jgi:hypothetical protein